MMRRMGSALGLACALVAIASMTGACGGSSAESSQAAAMPPPTPAQETVARVHRTKCGACHVRVERGARTRAQLEAALSRHRGRVHLREDEWEQLVDYLAKPEPEPAPLATPAPPVPQAATVPPPS